LALVAAVVAYSWWRGSSRRPGLFGSPARETPQIGELKIITTQLTPPGMTFSLTIDPSKAGVSADKSECWACIGDPARLQSLTPLFKKWKQEGKGFVSSVGNIYEGWWAGLCSLKPAAAAGAWTAEFSLTGDNSLTRTTVALSLVLLDDGGNASNQLNVWVDFETGQLVPGPGREPGPSGDK
jgi:hypothetical protein